LAILASSPPRYWQSLIPILAKGRSPKVQGSSSSLESAKVKMEKLEEQGTTTGKPEEPTPILAPEKPSTAEPLKPAPTKNENASIEIALILSLLQTDFSDLQSKGLRVVILAKENKLYASIEWQGHSLEVRDTGKKSKRSIILDGKPVVEYE
jgi:hypothetical protein